MSGPQGLEDQAQDHDKKQNLDHIIKPPEYSAERGIS
tara:strand:- start:2219 stop:2329 length:111 start_codon:yes stop_codon:yes gene_type:complete